MPQGALIFKWGTAVRGRESKAIEVFGESVGFWDDMAKNHRIDGHYPYFSTVRAAGIWLIHGELEDLMAIQSETDYQRLTSRVMQVVEDYSAEIHIGGSPGELADAMAIYNEVIEDVA